MKVLEVWRKYVNYRDDYGEKNSCKTREGKYLFYGMLLHVVWWKFTDVSEVLRRSALIALIVRQ
jgi:hypothetical protein